MGRRSWRGWQAAIAALSACAADSTVSFGPDPGARGSGGSTKLDAAAPPPPTANDAIQNGDETDVDCGESSGKPCADQAGCVQPADCASGVCVGGHCAAPSATDRVQNGDETDASWPSVRAASHRIRLG